jgi:hypothetical protein
MIQIEQIYQDINALPPEAQDLLVDFIQLLKKRYSQPKTDLLPLQTGKTYQVVTPLNSHKAAQTLAILLEETKEKIKP